MGAGWRYFATTLDGAGGETVLHPNLPLANVTIEDVLSGDSTMNAGVDPAAPELVGDDGRPILREWSTAIYAEYAGDIRFGGIIVSSDSTGPSWSFEAVGFTGYARGLPYTGSGYYGVYVDPLDCVRRIWDHVQSQPGGNIGLELGSTTTDVTIGTELEQVEFDTQEGPVSFEAGPWKLAWHLTHDLQGEVDDLAKETPFDYHERHFWDGDTLRHKLDFGYPSIGRRRSDLQFALGVNVFTPPSITRAADNYASGTLVLGAGEGSAMIHALSEPPSRPEGRLRRVAVVEDSSIRSKRRAKRRADAENQWRARMGDIETLLVHDHPHARLGAAQVGDEIRVGIETTWDRYEGWVRILAIAWQPENGNVAEYRVARPDRLV